MLYESRLPSTEIDIPVLSKDGWAAEFSNQGDKKHYNPSPVRLTEEPITCVLKDYPAIRCPNPSNRLDGLCKEHAPKKGRPKVLRKHWADWIGRLITPGRERKDCLAWAPAHGKMTEILLLWSASDKVKRAALEGFVSDIRDKLKGKVPDSTVLEEDAENHEEKDSEAFRLAMMARDSVDEWFPSETYGDEVTDGKTYKHRKDPKVSLKDIPVRVVAALLFLGVVSEEANRSDLWAYSKAGRAKSSKRASVFMPLSYYWLRAHHGANPTQASQSIRH